MKRRSRGRRYLRARLLRKALVEESALVSADSLKVLEAFERLSDGLDEELPKELRGSLRRSMIPERQ